MCAQHMVLLQLMRWTILLRRRPDICVNDMEYSIQRADIQYNCNTKGIRLSPTMRTQIQSVWVMHSESVLTQNFLFSNSEGKWRCKSRCGRARRRPWLRARRRPWRLCGGGGRDPAAREPRREAAMAEHRQPKSLRWRPRSLRADELPISRSSTMVPPHRAGSSPSWAHLTEATASCRRCHAPATDRDLRRGERRTHICVLHGVLPILGLLFGSAVGARFLPVA